MIDFLITLGAFAESKTVLPNRSFDDSQDCLTYIKRQVAGFGRLRIGPLRPEGNTPPAPWRSL